MNTFTIPSNQLYKDYLIFMNSLLKYSGKDTLTDKEIELVSYFMEQYDELGVNAPLLFSPFMRRKTQEALKISMYNLNNYIKSLIKKQIILKNNKALRLNPFIFPVKNEFGISININLVWNK